MASPEGSRRLKPAFYAIGAILALSLAVNIVLFRSTSREEPVAPAGTRSPVASKESPAGRPSARAVGGGGAPIPAPAPAPTSPPPSFYRSPPVGAPPEPLPQPATPAVILTPARAGKAAEAPRDAESARGPAPSARPAAVPPVVPAAGGPTSELTEATPSEKRTTVQVTSAAPLRAADGATADASDDKPEAPAADQDPGQDRTPPAIELLRFTPARVNDGGASSLVVQASDDLSGVRSVKGVLSNPSGTATVEFEAQGDGRADGVFSARIPIPPKAETGLWYVASLVVLDRASNRLDARYTPATVPAGGTLEVLSADSDSTPPEVLSFWMEKATVSEGESSALRVEAQDDRSGITVVRGEFTSPSKSAVIPFLCRPGADPGVWEERIAVPAAAECGRWTLQSLRVTDGADNTATLTASSPPTADAGFDVVGNQCGADPPTLQRLSLAPALVSNEAASEIRVTADVADPGGRALTVSGWVSGPASTNGQVPKIYFTCARSAKDAGAPWIGKIPVARFAARGIWRVDLVWLKDNSLATTSYTPKAPALAGSVFEVK